MCKTSAPGPDGITLGQIITKGPKFSRLTEMFNLWLITGTVPDALLDCRTVLIPKSSDAEKPGDINNWRPITIGSVVIRLFSRIATARLSKACPINPRQRGFICASGCAENLKLLQLVVEQLSESINIWGLCSWTLLRHLTPSVISMYLRVWSRERWIHT